MKRFALILLFALPSFSETMCPFLNTATAASILGENVTVSVIDTNTGSDDAACEFSPERSNDQFRLRIEVRTATDWKAECPSNSDRLRGIGNEAVGCRGTAKDGARYDQILSHVRERSLLVRVSTTDKKISLDTLREKGNKIADEVSGNLF